MLVVFVLCNTFCFHNTVGLRLAFPNLWGASPLSYGPLHNTWFLSSATQLPSSTPPLSADFTLSKCHEQKAPRTIV